jgi:hypothetical protein
MRFVLPNAPILIYKDYPHACHAMQRPKLCLPIAINTYQPLTLFYHAEKKLIQAIESMQRHFKVFPSLLPHLSSKVDHRQQHLLKVIYLIYHQSSMLCKTPRRYLRALPYEEQVHLGTGYNHSILYAAQALSKGYRVRGIEENSEDLKEPAIILCAAFNALRSQFWERSLKDCRPPYNDLEPVIKDFDRAWATFEKVLKYA